MDGIAVSELIGLSYGQLNYFCKQIDSLSSKSSGIKGKAREFNYRDVVLLKLAAMLREDKFRLAAINQAISEVDQNWKNSDDPDSAGVLLYGGDGLFRWSLKSDLTFVGTFDDKEDSQPLDLWQHIRRYFYNVRMIAYEFFDKVET